MPPAPIQDVAETALMVAAYRARESARPDALFHDAFAERLAGPRGMEIIDHLPGRFLGGWALVIRTVVIDEFLQQAIANGADCVLNLGAGFDARPYRMELPPDLRWIEVDIASMIAAKERILAGEQPRCRLRRVAMDLTDTAQVKRLLDEIHAESRKVVVLTEGVVPYLNEAAVGVLADTLHSEPVIQEWITDYFSPMMEKYRQRMTRNGGLQNAPFRFYPKDWHGFFRHHGWQQREARWLGPEGRRLGRPIPLPLLSTVVIILRMLFASAERRREAAQAAGYVVLERA